MPGIGNRVRAWAGMLAGLAGIGAGLSGAVALAAEADCSRLQRDGLACLACNIYHEARGQPEEGQMAVAMVTLNRLASPDYPDSICDVVWEQRRDRRTGRMVAQFSWTLDGRPDVVNEPVAWATAKRLASEALAEAQGGRSRRDPSLGALFFHADYVEPDWRNDPGMTLVAHIGNHLFYDRRGEGTSRPSAWGAKIRSPARSDPELPATLLRQPGAKLISLRPGAGGLIQVTVTDGDQVRRMTVARETGRAR